MSAGKLTPPAALNDFQRAYGKHLRRPTPTSRPAGIPARASEIYEELFFNNICGFINNCFPVAKSLFPEDTWLHICRTFFIDWRCHTPYFSEIPKEFVNYIKSDSHTLELPPWFAELIEYEWLELDVDICNATALNSHTNGDGKLYANPTLRNCAFKWPVHQISKNNIPSEPEATFLAIYRDAEHRVQFMAMNAITAALLEIIEQAPCSAQQALEQLAVAINHPQPQQIVNFGQSIIQDFLQRGMLAATP